MCRFKGEYYLTGIAHSCKFKDPFSDWKLTQCGGKNSHFVSVAWHRSWIEDVVRIRIPNPFQLQIQTITYFSKLHK